jgi:predicted transglutaminase-like cysteine proteinase
MGTRIICAAVAAMLSTAAQAQTQHAIEADESIYQPAGIREACSTMAWGVGEIRTDCRYEALAPEKTNPALKGICTIYYGRRTCY